MASVKTFLSVQPVLHKLYRQKSEAFIEEQEWRLLRVIHFDPTHDFDYGGPEIKYRTSGKAIVPYIEAAITTDHWRPIQRVFVGPKNSTPPAVISGFLKACGFPGVVVEPSDATYR